MGIRDSRTTHPRRIARQESAAHRREDYLSRTPQEQLAKLDREGHRALKERKRLLAKTT